MREESPDSLPVAPEPCLKILEVEFRDESIGLVAVTNKSDYTVLTGLVNGFKELKAADIKKRALKEVPIWEYGKSSAEKLKTCEMLNIEAKKPTKEAIDD
jgi:hypothetical protein